MGRIGGDAQALRPVAAIQGGRSPALETDGSSALMVWLDGEAIRAQWGGSEALARRAE